MQLTPDPHILPTVVGETIKFSSHPIRQSYPANSICKGHVALFEAEICSPTEKVVIVPSDHDLGEVISPIFSVPKKDGNVRLILNLKKLNTFVVNPHFKIVHLYSYYLYCKARESICL